MALELCMVGVIVEDMPRAAAFYRRLGLAVPDDAAEAEHVDVPMEGVTFFLNTSRSNAKWDPGAGGYRIVLEFHLPYDVTPELRFGMIDDPDGNTILLSAPVGADQP